MNLKRHFAERLELRKPDIMKSTLRRVGLLLEDTHHRGINDAKNVARLRPKIVETLEAQS
jgi:inhibitor of KinA sporulation pathway (predicted exonuclease)